MEPLGLLPRWWTQLGGIRARILTWFVALMIVAMVVSLLILRGVLLASLNERIDENLVQEVAELRQLVGGERPDGTCVSDLDRDGICDVGRNPTTGEPFGDDVRAIFETFLSRNLPSTNETFLTFVDGRPFLLPGVTPRYPLLDDERFRALGQITDTPVLGEHHLDAAGTVRYLAAPVLGTDQQTSGVFVVAQFVDFEAAGVREAIRAAMIAGLAMVVVASVLAWMVAGSVLRPVRTIIRTARSISDTDLHRRIDVRGSDEIADLAHTFNAMLDRIEEAFSAQRRFIDDAGHELRTPITIIRGHLELLGDDPTERAETVAIVTDELDRMTRMVDDLLVLAKAQRPDFLSLHDVDVGPLTEELFTKATALADRDWRLASVGPGRILADRHRLTQAVMQLAQNATQHTDSGDVVTLGSDVTDGQARFWVRDTGPGVADGTQRIFDRFFRGVGGRSRSEGAGLGLAIVRAIAEAHGGRVELSSPRGGGAEFTVVVPARRARTDDEATLEL